MIRDRIESNVPEGAEAKNIEASLAGPMQTTIFLYLKQKESEVKLYASDPSHKFICDPENGIGELKIAEMGGPDTIQIYIGNNTWKVVDMSAYHTSPMVRPSPAFSGSSLYLDEKSLQIVKDFLLAYEKSEEQRALGRGQERMAIRPEPVVVGSRGKESPKNDFELALENYALVEVKMEFFYSAGPVINNIFLDRSDPFFIDIMSEKGQEDFCTEWFKECGTKFSPPFVPPRAIFEKYFPNAQFPSGVSEAGDFTYLISLYEKRVVANIEESDDLGNIDIFPRFDLGNSCYVMNWQEVDINNKNEWGSSPLEGSSSITSLLEALGIKPGVFATRKEVDEALWVGDPGDCVPSKKHEAIINDMGLNPAEFILRPIDYGEYVRLVDKLALGKNKIETHFDGYFIDNADERRYGLCGGNVEKGGASHISFATANKKLAVRLVLARR